MEVVPITLVGTVRRICYCDFSNIHCALLFHFLKYFVLPGDKVSGFSLRTGRRKTYDYDFLATVWFYLGFCIS